MQQADVIVQVLSTDLSTVKLTQKTWKYLEEQGDAPPQAGLDEAT